jgi:hypothetical protein
MNVESVLLRCITGFDRTVLTGERLTGLTSQESVELARAKRGIRELELEVEILRRASKILGADHPGPKRIHPVIDQLSDDGFTDQALLPHSCQ